MKCETVYIGHVSDNALRDVIKNEINNFKLGEIIDFEIIYKYFEYNNVPSRIHSFLLIKYKGIG